MQAALQNHCNLNAAAAAKIINQGYDTPTDLTTLTEEGVKDLVAHINQNVNNVNVPFRAIDGLLNFRYWVILTERMGIATLPADYNQVEKDFVLKVRRDRKAWKLANPNKPTKPKALKDLKNGETGGTHLMPICPGVVVLLRFP